MQITAIRATPVSIPYRNATLMSGGVCARSVRTIVEVETDVGVTGVGEGSYGYAATVIERDFAPALIGLDPRDGVALRRHCLPDTLDFGTPLLKVRYAAWGALDIALWDIQGKACDLPLYQLLGGTARDRAEFVAYSYGTPEAATAAGTMAEIASAAVAASGARIFEFKVGVHPVEIDIATVEAAYSALNGRAQIAVDANMGWCEADARRFLQAVSPLLENVEEPVASLRGMQRLACDYKVNVSTHCTDLDAILPYPRVGVVPTLDACGGITGVRRLAHTLGALGRRIWLRSHAESGVGWAAVVHLGLSTPELDRPAQALIDLVEDDLILGDRWNVLNGGVRPPDKPGLGVSIDRDALARCHQHYIEHGDALAFPPALNRGRPRPAA